MIIDSAKLALTFFDTLTTLDSEDISIEVPNLFPLFRGLSNNIGNIEVKEVVLDFPKAHKPWKIFQDENLFISEFLNFYINKIDILDLKIGQRFYKTDLQNFYFILNSQKIL